MELIVVNELQDYLVAQAVAQMPATAPSTTRPAVYANPLDGAALPRQTAGDAAAESAAITLRSVSRPAPDVNEEAWEEEAVEVIVLAAAEETAELLQRQLRRLLAPAGTPGGRKMWTMGALLVESCAVWTGSQPMPVDPSRFQGFGRTQTFLFTCRVKSLAGLPYTP